VIRGIGLRGAVAVNVITMIGIGPLITIPLVLADLHGSAALVAWIVGAFIALCDGLVWAELGSLYASSGGTYFFLREAFGRERFGRATAFLFAWQIVLSAPLVLASGYIGFAHYAGYLWPPIASDARAQGFLAAAVGVVTLVLLYRRITTIGAIGVGLAATAVATLCAVIAAAVPHFSSRQALSADEHVGLAATLGAGLGAALVITIYDYYGYGSACTIGEEVRSPARVLPRSVIVSVLAVAGLYILLQIAVLGSIPWRELVPNADGSLPDIANYVASAVVERSWGLPAARVVTVAILVTAFASTFGNLLGYSRIPYAAAVDGLFFRPFARLDAHGKFPSVALVTIGLLALPACFFSLGDVINALVAGLTIVQGIAQVGAVAAIRARGVRAPYRMWLYPLPALIALAAWIYIFFSSGTQAIVFGLGSLGLGVIAFAWRARRATEWPFAKAVALLGIAAGSTFLVCGTATAATWGHADTVERDGNPIFEVDGKPFFVYGAAFFYERLPRDEWAPSMRELKAIGINTLDLYVPWNWHELRDGDFDFSGHTSPRRDLDEVLRLARTLDFKIILRPGPVVRNEWRNGGYPAWLLARPEYGMPLHDLLEGRYPPTATLQNAHSDDAAAEWMRNATHMTYARRWLERVLRECAPDADRIVAVALDDDQGAYIDNQTYPAPNLAAYLDWLRSVVQGVTGPREPVFINTYQMKVPASSPVWTMGNWYQSEAYSIGDHDRAQLEFSTALLQARPDQPMMASEFQAGWLLQPNDTRPRAVDPTNTSLALGTMIGMGVRGVVNFPAQDTLNPSGWEAPFANGFYAWDAAFDLGGRPSPRFWPTAKFGLLVQSLGPELAVSTVRYDAAIAYLGASYGTEAATNDLFAAIETATIAAQKACHDAHLTCALVDPTAIAPAALAHYRMLIVPSVPGAPALAPLAATRIAVYGLHGIVVNDVTDAVPLVAALRASGRRRVVEGVDDATFARDTTGALDGFLTVTNYANVVRNIPHGASVELDERRRVFLPAFTVPPHDAIVALVGLRLRALSASFGPRDELAFTDCVPTRFGRSRDVYLLDPGDPARVTNGCRLKARIGIHTYDRICSGSCALDGSGVRSRAKRPPGFSSRTIAYWPQTGLPIRSDAFVPVPEPSPPADGMAVVTTGDAFRDGSTSLTFDNGLVRLIVSPDAGGRAFVFEDDATRRSVFTSVGGLRDDVAIEPPLSTSDRIAKYTHQFPAGMFNRPYTATIAPRGTTAAANFEYDAPDVLPHGATFTRTVTLRPGERAFDLVEHVKFNEVEPGDAQRAVSVTSLSVGDTSKPMTTQSVLAPGAVTFAAETTIHVRDGHALGYYDAATSELATVAWRAGDISDAAVLEEDRSIVVRLTFAANDARVRFGYEHATSAADAARKLSEADAAAQAPPALSPGARARPAPRE
jgi:APA family basic amino acid/polyamine antiporter